MKMYTQFTYFDSPNTLFNTFSNKNFVCFYTMMEKDGKRFLLRKKYFNLVAQTYWIFLF